MEDTKKHHPFPSAEAAAEYEEWLTEMGLKEQADGKELIDTRDWLKMVLEKDDEYTV